LRETLPGFAAWLSGFAAGRSEVEMDSRIGRAYAAFTTASTTTVTTVAVACSEPY
jgi:hypothetical protein